MRHIPAKSAMFGWRTVSPTSCACQTRLTTSRSHLNGHRLPWSMMNLFQTAQKYLRSDAHCFVFAHQFSVEWKKGQRRNCCCCATRREVRASKPTIRHARGSKKNKRTKPNVRHAIAAHIKTSVGLKLVPLLNI